MKLGTMTVFAGAALVLAACASEPEPRPTSISDISVTSNIQSIGNAQAVQYWQSLPADLETALAAEFVGNITPAGAIVNVAVDEISLADAFSSQFGENSQLTGVVTLTDPADGEVFGTYNVAASSSQAASLLPEGTDVTTISPTDDAFYDAVVRAFANGVAQTVRQGS